MPAEYRVATEIDVILDATAPPTVRQPDVLVRHSGSTGTLTAADVVLVIEILSPSSHRVDRVTKRDEYARAGIPHYWIVDVDEQSAEVLALVDGRFKGSTVTGRIAVDVPAALDVDLTALTY
ncbi:hypothetical protein AXK60_03575 [Tsukamurella pseudospumae]|uniref:Putative restriction endonuclease domain-containing protein n=1 Tax=Tsukamurella pseudospumae TaxID=239498 RepID=A0A138AWY6_9ACTN|nr:hypothetical protein AXK61_00685 [Tsukamurella pseudospumae]KXP14955.1 hypothetical protein AXK60_03575 [Tsukamurella pseudospumae]